MKYDLNNIYFHVFHIFNDIFFMMAGLPESPIKNSLIKPHL